MGKTKRGKGTKIMGLADAGGLPLAVHIANASPHEVSVEFIWPDGYLISEESPIHS